MGNQKKTLLLITRGGTEPSVPNDKVLVITPNVLPFLSRIHVSNITKNMIRLSLLQYYPFLILSPFIFNWVYIRYPPN